MSLSRWRSAGYGSAETGVTACEFFIQLVLLKYYTDEAGLTPWLAGLALGIATLWDAITDPLLGYFSDQTQTRFGRRRPYMLAGAIVLSASFYMLFSPPLAASQTQCFVYLLFGYMLVNTGMSLISVPHLALASDLSHTLKQRTALFGWRFFFANLGLIIGILLPTLVGGSQDTISRDSASLTSLGLGIILMLTIAVALFATQGLDRSLERNGDRFSMFKGLLSIKRNKAYLWLLSAYALGSIGRTLNASIALFYYQYFLQLSERVVFIYILLPFTFTISLSIIFWTWVSRIIGKRLSFLIGSCFLGATTAVVYLVFPVGDWRFPAAYGVIAGFAIGAVFLLDAMVSDVSDYDRVFSGQRQEGMYFGVWRLDAKVSRALGLALSGFALQWIGFDQTQTQQSESTQWGLALLFGPVVGGIFLLSSVLQYFYPINLAKEQQINRILEKRQQKPVQGRGK